MESIALHTHKQLFLVRQINRLKSFPGLYRGIFFPQPGTNDQVPWHGDKKLRNFLRVPAKKTPPQEWGGGH
jgi:retron-type reverse transcriptase